jgi:thiaminase (transcriptional activator TenA)
MGPTGHCAFRLHALKYPMMKQFSFLLIFLHLFNFANAESAFVSEAWQKTAPLYQEIKNHPFIKELASGQLDESSFRIYIEQDYLFLLDRADCFAALAARAPTSELASYLLELSDGSKEGARKIFSKYNMPTPSQAELKKTAACQAYTEEMLRVAFEGSFNEGLVFLAPCALIYQEVGEYLKPLSFPNNPYQLWIDSYSSQERRRRIEKFITVIDSVTASASPEEIQALEAAFFKAAQFEYAFWDAAYEMGSDRTIGHF